MTITTVPWRAAIILCVITLGLGACTTVSRGTSQTISINTDPPGAACEMRQGARMILEETQTPVRFTIMRSPDALEIKCSLEGYDDVSMKLDPRPSLSIQKALDRKKLNTLEVGLDPIAVLTLTGMAIVLGGTDYLVGSATGALWEIDDDTVSVTLRGVGPGPGRDTGIRIMVPAQLQGEEIRWGARRDRPIP